jgi:magnesium chelatase family protein
MRTAAVFGIEACTVQVEVDVTVGLPSFTMVGLPDVSVRESRVRLRAEAAEDHGQSRACGHSQGRIVVRPADRARRACRVRLDQAS